MGKASKKKRQQELQSEAILNGKSLISSDISSKRSLFNKPLVHFFLIAIVGFLVYSNTFHVPFHLDDVRNIVENYKLRDLNNFWPPTTSRWFGYLTFALNYHFGGLNTIGYHIVNLSIHILNAILVYWLVVLTFRTPYFSASNPPPPPFSKVGTTRNRGGMGGFALFSALLFVAHPIQTQAVTYIVQRFTSLATMFYLLSLVMYIKFRLTPSLTLPPQGGGMGGWLQLHATRYTLYTVSLVSAILAMKTKEISFTLPVIIALYEFCFFDGKIKRRILFLIPLLLTMLIIPLSLIGTDKPIGDAIGELKEASQETEEISRWSYLSTQFRVIVTYIRLLFLPIHQNLDYDYPLYNSFLNPNVFLSFLFLLSIFGLGVYLFYRSRFTVHGSQSSDLQLETCNLKLVSFGIFWFFITLSVESSIIPIRDVIFEHRMYLPSVGAVIAFSIAIFYVLQFSVHRSRFTAYASRIPLSTVYLLLSTVVIVFSIATYQRNTIWQNGIALWKDVVEKAQGKARGHENLGLAYYNKEDGLIELAIEQYKKALELIPDYPQAYIDLGVAYSEKKLLDDAKKAFYKALDLWPDSAKAHNNLGAVYKYQGLTDEAIREYKKAIELNPDYPDAHNNLGVAYIEKGLLKEGIVEYRKAIALKPVAEIYFNLAMALEQAGEKQAAIKHYEEFIKLAPAKYNLHIEEAKRRIAKLQSIP